ncbi:MAG: TetR family transcriptional regulator, partial [Acidimicrobiaceae bacterium]
MPSPSVIPRRAPSARARANTTKVIRAIFRNAVDQGLDELSIGEVARLSGLTTGAIYGRYEDADEMAIELWQSVIRQPFKARLKRSIEFIVAGPHNLPSANRSKIVAEGALETVTKDFESPDEIAKLGAEFLVISRRNQTVGEVVIPEVTNWFSEFGLVNTNDPIVNATIVIGLSASIGTALRTFVLKANPSWMTIANALQDAATEATPVKIPINSPPPKWVEPETENPVRSALIDAVAEVVAKTGFANATISRIVRRAGVTNGSLYNLYKDKEALTDDAM